MTASVIRARTIDLRMYGLGHIPGDDDDNFTLYLYRYSVRYPPEEA